MFTRWPIITLSFALLTGCGTNFNTIFNNSEQENAIDQLLLEARYKYDKGEFSEALSIAEKARNIRPEGEDANVVLSYIHLGLAGLDTFNLAESLIEDNETTTDDTEQDKTANTFSQLAEALGITAADLQAMSTDTQTSGNITLYPPKTAPEARTSGSQSLYHLNQAITYLCPFIEDGAKLLGTDGEEVDGRHTGCEDSVEVLDNGPKSHFAWALAHLGEAIAFYSVIFYTDPGETVPNIQRATKQIDSATSDTGSYITQVTRLANLITQIFPTGDGSMLDAMFNNLDVTSKAFSVVAGLPDEVTASITTSITDLRNKVDSTTGSSDGSTALKNSLTKSINKELSKQFDKVNATPQQEQQICGCIVLINPNEVPPECRNVEPQCDEA